MNAHLPHPALQKTHKMTETDFLENVAEALKMVMRRTENVGSTEDIEQRRGIL